MTDTNPELPIVAFTTPAVRCIGIDLGTTHSLIAVWQDGKAHLLPNALGSVLTPSVVSIADDGEVLVGQAAKERLLTHPTHSASVFKRNMGTGKTVNLTGHDEPFSAENLSALVLQSLRHDAEHALGCTITDVVISVPAYFNDVQRKATRSAAQIAGLNVLRLVNEPTAAALSYGLHKANDETQFMVVDLGGGTLDVSVVELFENMIEVKSSTGDNQLGGEDFTRILAEILHEQILANPTTNQPNLSLKSLSNSSKANLEHQTKVFLHHQAERCKLALTNQDTFEWTAVFNGENYSFTVTQTLFESRCKNLLQRLRQAVERALRDAKVNPMQLHDIVLVGGASRMPIVQHSLQRLLGKQLNTAVQPDEAIALGAAILAGLCAQDSALDEIMMTDVCPYSLGVDIYNSDDLRGTDGHLFSPIIERNTLIPVSRCEIYAPVHDYQTEVVLTIFQGEARLVRDNLKLGTLVVPLPRRKKDDLSIEVRFSYDISGLLEVDATVLPTQAKYKLSLMGQAVNLSKPEITACQEQLARLKISPRDQQENRSLIAKLERLYQEHLDEQRGAIGQAHSQFLSAIAQQNLPEISRMRLQLNTWCDEIENLSPSNIDTSIDTSKTSDLNTP